MLTNRYIASANVLGASLAMLNSFAPMAAEAQQVRTFKAPMRMDSDAQPFSNVSLADVTIRPLLAKIERLSILADGWDGPGSARPTDQTIATASAFVRSIPLTVAPPELAAAGDGEISLSWRTDNLFVDVSIEGETASAFANVADLPFKVRSLTSLQDLPAAVVQAITRI